jgi:hypothetical protein
MAQPHVRETSDRETTREATEQELSAVLGRFRAWNSNADNSLRTDHRQQLDEDSYHPADSVASLQEISYEDALGARRKVDQPTSVPSQKTTRQMPRTPIAAVGNAKAPVTTRKRPAKAATGVHGLQPAPVSRRPVADRKLQPSLKAAVSRPKPANMPTQAATRNLAQATAQQPPSKPRKSTFQQVMQESLAVNMSKSHRTEAADRVPLTRTMEEKSVALHLRASAHEHAIIQAGASEAGVTIAEYMRQCTLDVQVLRTLLNQTIASRNLNSIAATQQKRPRPADETTLALPAPAPSPLEPEETFVTRLKTLFFGTRKR